MDSELAMIVSNNHHHLSVNEEVTMNLIDHDLSPLSVTCVYSDSNFDDCDGLTRRERILLRPWLENLIDSGQLPGLEWIDRSKYIFKVPWKHRSKKSWSVEHSSVFLEWAKNTGRWRQGDPEPNYAQLKTRLRCAFNKAPDIQEIKELHKTKCEEAYKVYRFVPKKESRFGNFKKKMLIPTSVKRRHCSWMSGMKYQTPGKKLKQEEPVEPSKIKSEPMCGSSEEYCDGTPNASIYRETDYRYGTSDRSPSPRRGISMTSNVSMIDGTSKYAKQSSGYLLQDNVAMFPGRIPGSEMSGGWPRRCEEGSLRGNPFDPEGGYPICSDDLTYKRNYERMHLQNKFNPKSFYHAYSQGHARQPYHDSDLSNPSPYPDISRRAASDRPSFVMMTGESSHHLKLQSQHVSTKFHLNDDRQMYRSRMDDQDRFDLVNNNQYPPTPSYDIKSRPIDDLMTPQLRGQGHSSTIKSPFVDSPISQPSNISNGSEPVAASLPSCSSLSCDFYYPNRPVLETAKSSDRVDAMRQGGCLGKEVPKIGECSLIDVDKMVPPDGNMEPKDKVIQDQLPSMTINKSVGLNVLDLTKKVKMAVAPFISQPRAQQPQSNLNQDPNQAHSGLHSTNSALDKINEYMTNPPNGKFLDFIEWERRLIERERELLARERLMTLKEKNLRELEIAIRLDQKFEFSGLESNLLKMNRPVEDVRKFEKMAFGASRSDKSSELKSSVRSVRQPSPPPLSPLRNFSDVNFVDRGFVDPRWSGGTFNGDSSPRSNSSDDSDVYYSQLFNNSNNNNNKHSNGDAVEHARSCYERTNPHFINNNNVRDDYNVSKMSSVGKYASPEILVIPRNKDLHRTSVPSGDEATRDRDRARDLEKSDEEYSKVLPVVDSLSSEEVLHIAKLPEQISEERSVVTSSRPEVDAPFPTSKDKDCSSRKEDFHEEVWKRRMKWKSFQSNCQVKGASNSHWIWPNIGNLGGSQQQEQNKLDVID